LCEIVLNVPPLSLDTHAVVCWYILQTKIWQNKKHTNTLPLWTTFASFGWEPLWFCRWWGRLCGRSSDGPTSLTPRHSNLRSTSTTDLQAAQRAKARQQYAEWSRMKSSLTRELWIYAREARGKTGEGRNTFARTCCLFFFSSPLSLLANIWRVLYP
jgi:hypothetical protein